jgi:hypothetical protein
MSGPFKDFATMHICWFSSVSDHTASSGWIKIICKAIEGRGHGLSKGTVSIFMWKGREKLKNAQKIRCTCQN